MSKSLFVALIILIGSTLVPCSASGEELVGPVSRDDILAHSPAWEGIAAAYQPDAGALDKLRGLSREVRIEVYFGSWCSDSVAHVPAFFKVLDLAETPLLQAAYTAVPEDKAKRAPYCADRKIVKLPTFVVLVDGREAGRIEETPGKSVEADLVRILGL